MYYAKYLRRSTDRPTVWEHGSPQNFTFLAFPSEKDRETAEEYVWKETEGRLIACSRAEVESVAGQDFVVRDGQVGWYDKNIEEYVMLSDKASFPKELSQFFGREFTCLKCGKETIESNSSNFLVLPRNIRSTRNTRCCRTAEVLRYISGVSSPIGLITTERKPNKRRK